MAEIFTRAVHETASKVYSSKQCEAWSDRTPNPSHWKKRCARKQPFVFVEEGKVAGFLELDPDGHIDCLYVDPDRQRQGIASRLVEHAVTTCRQRGLANVGVEASICARPLFERHGFEVICEQQVERKGVFLTNFRMQLPLAAGIRKVSASP